MNYLHIFVIIITLIFIKITVLTNKKFKEIFKYVLMLLCITLLVLVGCLAIRRPLLGIVSIDTEDDYRMVSIMHLDEGRLYDVIGFEDEKEVLALLNECKIGYSLKFYNPRYRTSSVVMTILIIKGNQNTSFGITNDNLILHDGKYYRILESDILDELTKIVSTNNNTIKWKDINTIEPN